MPEVNEPEDKEKSQEAAIRRQMEFMRALVRDAECIVRSARTNREYRGVVTGSQQITIDGGKTARTIYLVRVNGESVAVFDATGVEFGNKGGLRTARRLEPMRPHVRDRLLKRELFTKIQKAIKEDGEDCMTVERMRQTWAFVRQTATERAAQKAQDTEALERAYRAASQTPVSKEKEIGDAPRLLRPEENAE